MVSLFNILKTTTEPVTEPVSLAEAKQYMGITTTDFDSLITDIISVERAQVEDFCQVALVPSSVSFQSRVSWPIYEEEQMTMIPWVGSYSTLEMLDENDNPLTIDSNYSTSGNWLFFYSTGNFTVNLQTNYQIPLPLKQAIKMLVAYRFNNRGDQAEQLGIPLDIKTKLNSYKVLWQ